MLIKRLRKQERKLAHLDVPSTWKNLAIPTVSALLLFATHGVQATDFSEEEDEEESKVLAISLSNTNVDAYATRGTVVGTISGSAGENAPFSLVSSGDAQDDDNGLFSIIGGDSLVVNDDIWKKNKSSLSIYLQGTGNTTPFAISLTVTGLPTQTGDRGFTNVATLASNVRSVKVGDIDGDGNLDVFESRSSEIIIRRSYGDLTFYAADTIDPGGSGIDEFVIGDLDKDGDIDIVITGNVGTGKVFTNDGNGLFSPVANAALDGTDFGSGVSLGDLDSDGYPDLAFREGLSTRVYLNNGDATFTENVSPGITTVGITQEFGDVDDDGNLDLLITRGNGTFVYYGNGTGGFSAVDTINTTGSSGAIFSDVDGDGDLDALIRESLNLRIAENTGNPAPNRWNPPVASGLTTQDFFTTGDYDGDGDLDIMHEDFYYVGLATNDGAFTFNDQFFFQNKYEDGVFSDLDKDGDLDLIMVPYSGGPSVVFENRLNNPATSILFDQPSIDIYAPKGTVVGQLSVTDPEGDQSTFSLGNGGLHNGAFTIRNGNQLVVNDEIYRLSDGGASNFSLDILATDIFGLPYSQTVIIPMGNLPTGGGAFDDPAISVSNGPYLALQGEVGYIDADGNLDVAIVRADTVDVFYGDGLGDFPTSNKIFISGANNDISLGDLDNDGDLDIVVGGFFGPGQSAVHINEGGGTWNPYYTSALYYESFLQIELGDVDQDGDLDIVTRDGGTSIGVTLNDGNGYFSYKFSNDGINNEGPFDLGDVDQDGDLDIVMAYSGAATIYYNEFPMNPPFSSSYTFISGPGIAPQKLELVDANEDGFLDAFVAADSDLGGLYLNSAGIDGTADAFTSGYQDGLVTGDIDGDGTIDVFLNSAAYNSNNEYTFLPGFGNQMPWSGPIGINGFTNDLLLGDLDSDGDLDFFLVNSTGTHDVLWGRTNDPITDITLTPSIINQYDEEGTVVGTLGATQSDADPVTFGMDTTASTTIHSGSFVVAGNELVVNDDLFVLRSPGQDPTVEFTITANDGFATFIKTFNILPEGVPNGGGDFSSSVNFGNFPTYNAAFGDLDGDGNLDIVMSNSDSVFIEYGDGAGNFGSQYTLITGVNVNDIEIGDIDQDGDLDLFLVGENFPIFYRDGVIFNNATHYIYNGKYAAEFADFDGDGDLDVVTANGSFVNVWDNTGSDFNNEGSNGIGGSAHKVLLGDLDKDGDLDALAFENNGPGYIRFYRSNYDYFQFGKFQWSYEGELSTNQGDVELADLDGDGDLDVFMSNMSNPILFNDGTGSFTPGSAIAGIPGGGKVDIGDLDGDGDLDAIIGDGSGLYYLALNDGVGVFTSAGQQFGGIMYDEASEITLGDVDADGDLDVFVAKFQYDSINFEFVSDVLILNETPNTPAVLVNSSLTVDEGNTFILTSTELLATDGEQPDTEILFQVQTLPANGSIQLNSSDLAVNDSFTQDDVNLGFVQYVHDGSETTTDGFDISLSDGIVASGTSTFNITINPINDAPIVNINTNLVVNEGDLGNIIANTLLSSSDIEQTAAQLTYTVTTLPVNGDLRRDGTILIANDTFTQDDVDAGLVTYDHDGSATIADSFVFDLSDGAGGDVTGQTFNIDIIPLGDVTPPSTTVDFLSTNDNTPPLSGTIDDNTATVSVTVDGTNYGATNNGDGTWGLADNTITTLADGFYDVVVIGTDLATNTDEDTTFNALFIDTTLPVVSTDVLNTNDNTPPLTGTIDDNFASISINIDGSDYGATNNGDGTWTLADNTITTLADGTYDVTATATDTVGNVGVDNAIGVVTVDTTPPTVTIDALTTADTTPELTGTVDDNGATITVDVDIYSETATNNGDGTWTLADNTLGALTLGTYDVAVTATDGLGNAGTDATTDELEIIVDPGRALDSAALVQVYTATGGPNWTDNTNWLTGALETWTGVTVTVDRVTAVDLSSNDLTGTFPFITTGLDAATDLNLSDNELTDVGDLSNLTGLTNVDVTDNRLQFNTVGALLGGSYTLTYQTQKEVLASIQTLEQVGDPYTLDRTIAGADGYSWFKDGTPTGQTTATINIASLQTTDDGLYTVEATSSTITDLTLTTTEIDLRVSSLERDEKSLRLVYEGFADNAGISDWSGTSVSEWSEVTITDNRVTGLDISGLGVEGPMADDLLDVEGLQTVDISDNAITLIPDVTSLEGLTSFDASENPLDFASIEPNINNEVTFESLKPFGEATVLNLARGENTTLSQTVGGTTNIYQWVFRNDSLPEANQDFADVAGATTTIYDLTNLDYETMGRYKLEVSNTQSTIVLESKEQEVLATANISFTPVFEFSDGTGGTVKEGEAKLFRITESGPYEGVDTVNVVNENILFENVKLGNYILNVRTEPEYVEILPQIDTVQFIPTYFVSTIDWLDADVLRLRDFIDESLTMQRVPPPTEGEGEIAMLVESDFEDDPGGRLEARRRVQKAGCSLRRRTTGGGGRPAQDDDEFVLIAYKETDDNGQVNFGELPNGTYRLNIQYPGIPMDPDSFVEFEIDADGGVGGYELEATVTEDGIVVENILGIRSDYFKDLSVYPVPAQDEVTISYRRLLIEDVQIRLTDLNGKTVIKRGLEVGVNKTLNLDVSSLQGGVYLLQVFNDREGTIARYKIIVNKQ